MHLSLLLLITACATLHAGDTRAPKSEADLRAWLENMVWHHRFSHQEVSAATGLPMEKVLAELNRLGISPEKKPRHEPGKLLVLPYPGGRHPRIGFLDGAIDPQRETKLSIFTPWDEGAYIVADVPEAIWSNLGLTYLAHTHIPTIWGDRPLAKLEWQKLADGSYRMERALPNGIVFGTHARPATNALFLKMWLSNGTDRALSDLRVQNCVMLKGAPGFSQQTNENKILRGSFAACRDASGERWVITGFAPIGRVWANPPVPCLHADPKFPNTAPGQQTEIQGLITFHEGPAIEAKLKALEAELAAMK